MRSIRVLSEPERIELLRLYLREKLPLRVISKTMQIDEVTVSNALSRMLKDRDLIRRVAPEVLGDDESIGIPEIYSLGNSFHPKQALSSDEFEYASIVDYDAHYRNFKFKHK